MDINKDIFKDFGEKASEMTNMVKLKFEIKNHEKNLKKEITKLGTIVVTCYNEKNFKAENEDILKQIDLVKESEAALFKMNHDYEDMRMDNSDNFVINKMMDDFAKTGSVITQAYISSKSNVVGKKLKSTKLPKETLISAVKRNDEMIIPDGNTVLMANDKVFIVGKKDDVEQLIKRLSAE